VTLAAGAVLAAPTPYSAVYPGSARPTGAVLRLELHAAGRPDRPGAVLLTTVMTREANGLWVLWALAHPGIDLVRTETLLPEGMSSDAYLARSRRLMEASQKLASVAALRALGFEPTVRGAGARVSHVFPSAAAALPLEPGDVIIEAAGRPVELVEHLEQAISRLPPGAGLELLVRRADGTTDRAWVASRGAGAGPARFGFLVEEEDLAVGLPVPVVIEPGAIVGPSAGLAFALEIVDQLRGGELTRGRLVAATGVVYSDGRIGPVGGIGHKARGARRAGAVVFLVPRSGSLPRRPPDGLEVVPISHLGEAIGALEVGRPDGRPPAFRCGPPAVCYNVGSESLSATRAGDREKRGDAH